MKSLGVTYPSKMDQDSSNRNIHLPSANIQEIAEKLFHARRDIPEWIVGR